MKPFYTSLALHEVHHLKNPLESAGLACLLRNKGLATLAGGVPFVECAGQLFLLRDDDRPEAAKLLRAWRAGPGCGPAGACPRCGETLEHQPTTRWRCGTDRPPHTT